MVASIYESLAALARELDRLERSHAALASDVTPANGAASRRAPPIQAASSHGPSGRRASRPCS